jgi:hypothetical protein
MAWVRAHGFVNYKKGCTRLTAASDKSLPVACRWFSLGTAESGIKHKNQFKWIPSLDIDHH